MLSNLRLLKPKNVQKIFRLHLLLGSSKKCLYHLHKDHTRLLKPMQQLITTLVLVAAFIFSSAKEAAATPSTLPAPNRPHPVLRHVGANNNRNSMVGKAQTTPARGAAIGTAAQAAAGGNSNPLLNKKKRSKQ